MWRFSSELKMAGQMKNVELEDEFGDPPPYESTTTTEGVEQQKGFNREYLFSAPGALRVVEMALGLIAFICVVAAGYGGSGFVLWTTVSGFITSTILFFLIAFRIYTRLPGFWYLYELVYLLLYTLKYFIATIISAVNAKYMTSIMMACIFCAVAFFIYLLDTVMAYKRYQAAKEEQERQKHTGEGAASNRRGESFCIIF